MALSQQALAEKIGITRQYLSDIENMKKQPTIQIAFTISEVLEIDINELFYKCYSYNLISRFISLFKSYHSI